MQRIYLVKLNPISLTATNPDRVPFMAAIKSKEESPLVALLIAILQTKELIQAAEEARKVLTAHKAAMSAWYGLSVPKRSAEPGLKPNLRNKETEQG